MALMIRGIEVLAVPARRENDSRADALGTELVRQLRRVLVVAGGEALAVAEAAVADGRAVGLLDARVAGDHAEAGLEGRHFVVLG